MGGGAGAAAYEIRALAEKERQAITSGLTPEQAMAVLDRIIERCSDIIKADAGGWY